MAEDAPDPTSDLLDRARAGDSGALDQLFERHMPRIRRWASGRLPRWARNIADTSDVVHDTIVETLKHLQNFEHRGDGALQAYLRQAVMNRIRNELRKLAVRGVPGGARLPGAGHRHIPPDRAMATETFERYETGLSRLTPEEREAVVSRLELGLSYAEIAEVLGKPTANAARMTVVRAVTRLAEEVKGQRG